MTCAPTNQVRALRVLCAATFMLVTLGTTLPRAHAASAEHDELASKKSIFTIEIDPLTFALGGYGVLLSYRPSSHPHWRLAVSSFSFTLPNFLAEIGGNSGFHMHIRPSAQMQLHRVFSRGHHRFHTGAGLALFRPEYSHSDDDSAEHARVTSLVVAAQAGYQWHPLGGALFIEPWLSLGRSLVDRGDAKLESIDKTYSTAPISVNLLFHIGAEF